MTKTRKPPKEVFKKHPTPEETVELAHAERTVNAFISLTDDHMGMYEVERLESHLAFSFAGRPVAKVGPLKGTLNAWGVYRASPNAPLLSHMGTFGKPSAACACAIQECYHLIVSHALDHLCERLLATDDYVKKARRDPNED